MSILVGHRLSEGTYVCMDCGFKNHFEAVMKLPFRDTIYSSNKKIDECQCADCGKWILGPVDYGDE